jgi:hypothetical protein
MVLRKLRKLGQYLPLTGEEHNPKPTIIMTWSTRQPSLRNYKEVLRVLSSTA